MNSQIHRSRPECRFRATTCAGFSVVEMLVAVTVSMFVMGALIVVVSGSSSTGRTRDRASALQINGRYALEQIKNDLQNAGFLGISSLFFPDQSLTASGINVTNVCDSNNVGKLSLRVWGANDANPYAATCIPAANYSLGDVMVVRSLNPTPVTATTDTTLVYFHSSYEKGAAFKGSATPMDCTGAVYRSPCMDYLVNEVVYYISPYTNSPTESPLVPALYRLRLSNGPTMIRELVASGVENMQVRYGVFQTDSTTRYLAADVLTSTDWDAVRSVQLWLLMRASTTDAGYQNTTTYTMGTHVVTVNDNYPRLLMSAVIDLRN
jgi:type IV pilus assembly protein PilW